jgi:hypothetical protein
MSHEQFMDEPTSVIDWTITLDGLRIEVEEEWQQN